jgi:murein L,D-transpeptidase YafK
MPASPLALLTAGCLALSAASAGAAESILLPVKQVFPGDDGAAAATLDRPLAGLVEAWRARTGKRTFQKRIVVHKARRRLDVFADGDLLKSYLVELGLAPVGAKRRQGDMRTPEGDYFLCTRNRASQFTRFLGISYPSPAAAAAAVAARKVGAAVERDTVAAYRTRDRCPPQLTSLGGAVGIHGKGEWERRGEAFALVDWTWGCVALRDQDVLELFDGYAEVGIPIRIVAD